MITKLEKFLRLAMIALGVVVYYWSLSITQTVFNVLIALFGGFTWILFKKPTTQVRTAIFAIVVLGPLALCSLSEGKWSVIGYVSVIFSCVEGIIAATLFLRKIDREETEEMQQY